MGFLGGRSGFGQNPEVTLVVLQTSTCFELLGPLCPGMGLEFGPLQQSPSSQIKAGREYIPRPTFSNFVLPIQSPVSWVDNKGCLYSPASRALGVGSRGESMAVMGCQDSPDSHIQISMMGGLTATTYDRVCMCACVLHVYVCVCAPFHLFF